MSLYMVTLLSCTLICTARCRWLHGSNTHTGCTQTSSWSHLLRKPDGGHPRCQWLPSARTNSQKQQQHQHVWQLKGCQGPDTSMPLNGP